MASEHQLVLDRFNDAWKNLQNELYELTNIMPELIIPDKIPTKHLLKYKDIREIESGKVPSILVIEPPDYNYVRVLDKDDETIVEEYWIFNDPPKSADLATTGSGNDVWIKASPEFDRFLEKQTALLEKQLKKLQKAPKTTKAPKEPKTTKEPKAPKATKEPDYAAATAEYTKWAETNILKLNTKIEEISKKTKLPPPQELEEKLLKLIARFREDGEKKQRAIHKKYNIV